MDAGVGLVSDDRAGSPRPAAFHTAWYRTTTGWRRERTSFLLLVVLIGLVGGVALGSIAAARRTDSSYATFLANSNPSDLMIDPAGGPGVGQPNQAQHLVDAVRRYPEVKQVEAYEALNASLVVAGRVHERSLNSNVVLVGSVDGLLFNQDRFAITSGRMADPTRANEVMVTQNAATALGLHLDEVLDVRVSSTSGSGPARTFGLKVVGIGLLNREVVQDRNCQVPHIHRGDPGPHPDGLRRQLNRVPGCPAATGCGRCPSSGAALELNRGLLHRLPGHFGVGGRSQSGDKARGARAQCVRGYCRPGRPPSRDTTCGAATECPRA